MNPNNHRDPWSRLVAAARRERDSRDDSAPYGFSTRVAALALTPARRAASLLDRVALRAVAVASLLAIASVVFNYSSVSSSSVAGGDDTNLTTDDAMSVLLDT